MRIDVDSSGSDAEWRAAFARDLPREITAAAYAALQDTARDIETAGRQAIAAGGFGPRWQQAFRVKVFPSKPSLNAAIFAYHKIPYAGLFETGGTVRGRPLLWLPTRNVPVVAGGGRPSPAKFVRAGGQLSGGRRGRKGRPILFGKRAGAKGFKPMFIGVPAVTIGKQFSVGEAIQQAAEQFDSHLTSRLGA